MQCRTDWLQGVGAAFIYTLILFSEKGQRGMVGEGMNVVSLVEHDGSRLFQGEKVLQGNSRLFAGSHRL